MKKKDSPTIYIPKQKGRQQSFWYEHRNPLAEYHGYSLNVFCESIIRDRHMTWKVELDEIKRAAKNDKGLKRLVGNEGRLKRNQNWWWDDTTSFEVIDNNGDSLGEVFTYDEGIKLLVKIGNENPIIVSVKQDGYPQRDPYPCELNQPDEDYE